MDLLIIAGFLGSGKTSVLIPLAKSLVGCGKSVTIIENEVGKVGIDNQILEEEKLNVKELFSGCVCCQLRVDLLNTLYELERTIEPDVVIIEPSGVAAPGMVLDTFLGYGGEINRKVALVLADATRFHLLKIMSLPLVENSIQAADVVAINKIDLVSSVELQQVTDNIRQVKSDVEIIPISAVQEINLDLLFSRVNSLLTADVTAEEKYSKIGDIDAPTPTIHSREFVFTFNNPISSELLIKELKEFFRYLVNELREAGCTLIGHIKAIVKPQNGGYCLLNVTNFDQEPVCRGGIPKSMNQINLTLNAIVYGIDLFILYEKFSLLNERLENIV
jgi:G3E family GTPase